MTSRDDDAKAPAPPPRPARVSPEMRAAETTRVAREATDRTTALRVAAVARLKAQRLEKEAADRAAAPVAKARKRG